MERKGGGKPLRVVLAKTLLDSFAATKGVFRRRKKKGSRHSASKSWGSKGSPCFMPTPKAVPDTKTHPEAPWRPPREIGQNRKRVWEQMIHASPPKSSIGQRSKVIPCKRKYVYHERIMNMGGLPPPLKQLLWINTQVSTEFCCWEQLWQAGCWVPLQLAQNSKQAYDSWIQTLPGHFVSPWLVKQ